MLFVTSVTLATSVVSAISVLFATSALCAAVSAVPMLHWVLFFAERMIDRSTETDRLYMIQCVPDVRAEGGQGVRRVHGRGTQQEVPLLSRPPGELQQQ